MFSGKQYSIEPVTNTEHLCMFQLSYQMLKSSLLFVRIAVSLSLGMGGGMGMDWNQFRSMPLPEVLSVRVLRFLTHAYRPLNNWLTLVPFGKMLHWTGLTKLYSLYIYYL